MRPTVLLAQFALLSNLIACTAYAQTAKSLAGVPGTCLYAKAGTSIGGAKVLSGTFVSCIVTDDKGQATKSYKGTEDGTKLQLEDDQVVQYSPRTGEFVSTKKKTKTSPEKPDR
jgi:hypothetical protein